VQAEKGRALHCDTEGDEGIVHGGATILRRIFRSRTRDLEMRKVDKLREGSHKRWDVGCSVEQRRVLHDEEIGQFRRSILRQFGIHFKLGFVVELSLLAGLRVYERR
jgi:hypothetical protein